MCSVAGPAILIFMVAMVLRVTQRGLISQNRCWAVPLRFQVLTRWRLMIVMEKAECLGIETLKGHLLSGTTLLWVESRAGQCTSFSELSVPRRE